MLTFVRHMPQVVDGLTQLFITFAVSVAGLRFGIHTSTFLHTLRGTSPQSTANVPKKHFFYGATVLIAILCWVAVLVLTILLPFYRHVTFALLFAPFGTILRFWLAKINRYDVQLPWGTLSANLIGTAILAACTAIQRRPGVTFLSCGVLQGFDDGFCGCLTTVSTFAVELRGLRRLPAYIYTAVSILTCISLVVLIYGSVWWSIGLVARCSFETARSL